MRCVLTSAGFFSSFRGSEESSLKDSVSSFKSTILVVLSCVLSDSVGITRISESDGGDIIFEDVACHS